MAPDRIIFLDIDGVLNCRRTPNPRKFPYIVDLPLLERFRAAMGRAEAAAVLASTWRYSSNRKAAHLRMIFQPGQDLVPARSVRHVGRDIDEENAPVPGAE